MRTDDPDTPADEPDSADNGRDSPDDRSEQNSKAATVEKVVMALSIIVTVLLFAYAGWQSVGAPVSAPPEATAVGTDRLPNGNVTVAFELRNPRDVGLVTVTVESACTS